MPSKHGFCSIYQMLLLFAETPFINKQQVSLINCKERRWEFCVHGTQGIRPLQSYYPLSSTIVQQVLEQGTTALSSSPYPH